METVLIIIAILLAAAFGHIYYQNSQQPELGVTQGKLALLSKNPNNVSTQAETENKKVATLAFKESTAATMIAIKKAVDNYGGATIEQESEEYLYVIFTTSLMR